MAIFHSEHPYDIQNGIGEEPPANLNQSTGGLSLAEIVTDFSDGPLVQTGETFDVAISGPGFLKVSNGNVILEARKSICTNRDVWEISLTGMIASRDITRDNTALSENIANLRIVKKQRGKVYDSTRRPWGNLLYDLFFPF